MQIIQKRSIHESLEKPVLICYLKTPEKPDTSVEFEKLVESAGYTVVELIKCSDKPDSDYYFAKRDVRKIRHALGRIRTAKLVIFGTVLTPRQYSNLARELRKYRIMDQFELFLRLFGSRTTKRETMLELQLAALKYQFPFQRNFLLEQQFALEQMGYGRAEDLKLLQIPFSRMGFHYAMRHLERKLERFRKQRENQRKQRLKKADRGELIGCSVVGYTNAGKSSFLNAITASSLETSSKMLTTLSTATRRVDYQDLPVILTDTVGFFQDLPEELIEPFTSTLEESLCSDVILLLLDCSEPVEEIRRKLKASFDILRKIDDKFLGRMWVLLTKVDLIAEEEVEATKKLLPDIIDEQSSSISFDKENIEVISSIKFDFGGFYQLLDRWFPPKQIRLRIPFDYPETYSLVHEQFMVMREQLNATSWFLEIKTRKSAILDSIKKKQGDRITCCQS
ncbi:MAG: GTPase [Candidatus Thorarchaeota archaeon]